MTGFFRFAGGTVVGDAFNRGGHKITQQTMRAFYLKPIDDLSTMEWQHATADFKRVLTRGIKGIIEDIDTSMQGNTADEQTEFLQGLKKVAETMILWAHKCSDRARTFAKTVENAEHKANLTRLADALLRVPEHAPSNFYEAVLTVYVCYSADPDSIGVPDRYFLPFYRKGIADGTLTRDEAKAYLQELFLELQAKTKVTSPNFTRGGESHFCIGGYLPSGEDGYNEHHKWFGAKMRAFPDGRYDGDLLKFGIGQSEGKDRCGLTALLNSLAKMDPRGIGCGATVTNVMLDAALVRDEANFEKTVDLFETYFKNGGVHFQLSYVSREDLLAAKETPENYGHLRVRVSGFSDYFVRLNCDLQNDIIARTSQK